MQITEHSTLGRKCHSIPAINRILSCANGYSQVLVWTLEMRPKRGFYMSTNYLSTNNLLTSNLSTNNLSTNNLSLTNSFSPENELCDGQKSAYHAFCDLHCKRTLDRYSPSEDSLK